jgi:branched-subunit amino acid transport protein AzlD
MDKIIIKKKGKNQMKNITKLLPIALIGLFMVSCQNDDEHKFKTIGRVIKQLLQGLLQRK